MEGWVRWLGRLWIFVRVVRGRGLQRVYGRECKGGLSVERLFVLDISSWDAATSGNIIETTMGCRC